MVALAEKSIASTNQQLTPSEIQKVLEEIEDPKPPPCSAIDEAIHRVLISRPHHALAPTFEDLQALIDPADFKAIQNMKEIIEQQG